MPKKALITEILAPNEAGRGWRFATYNGGQVR